MKPRAAAWLLTAALLWGTTGTAQALGDAASSPLSVGAVRLAVGSVGLVTAAGGLRTRPPPGWLTLGAAAMAGYQMAFFSGVARAGVALGTVVAIGSAPVVAGLLAWVVRGDSPSARWWASTALAVAGVALITGRPQEVDTVGVAMAVAAGACYALATLASKYLLEVMAPTSAMAWLFAMAALLLSPSLVGADLAWLARPRGMVAAAWLGLGATTLAYLAFARGLREATVGQAATVALAEPATATLLGVALVGERPGVAAWLGVGLVALALVVLTRRQRVVIA